MTPKRDIDRMKETLRSHGISMSVAGCGCCGSPWVFFEYNGEVIVGNPDATKKYREEDDCKFSTFER